MIRAAVCDDEAPALEQICAAVRAFAASQKDGPAIQTEGFLSPEQLCRSVAEGKLFDLFLLDVEMPGMSGLEAAERIRESCPSAVILFLTSHTEFPFVQEGYKVGALRYVCKLDMETALPEALRAAVELCAEQDASFLTLTWHSSGVRIPLSEIVAVRRVARTLEIETERQGVLYDSRSLKDLVEALDDRRFLYTDRSTVVNLDHVRRLSRDGLVLKNGTELTVSRKLLPRVKASILQMWGKAR